MKKIGTKLFLLLSVCILTASCETAKKDAAANYYVDPQNGDDANTGTKAGKPFKSLHKISELKLNPGDSILLKSGAIFTEKLYLSATGSAGKPIVVGKYGGEAKPHIKGDGTEKEMVHIFNSEHIVVRDLEISNKGINPLPGTKGLWIQLKEYGKATHTQIDNLYIHDVYGKVALDEGGGTALCIQNAAEEDTLLSCFDGLTIENCHIKDSQRDAIRMHANWLRDKWLPNTSVVIRNNRIEGVPGDGIVVTGCDGALVEYNIIKNCPATLPPSECCDGIWPWSSDNTLVQYNIVSDHHSICDGYAYDSDWNCRNSVFQYNLSYNNVGGFMLVIATNGWPDEMCVNGNEDTQIRYNISINDGNRDYPTRSDYKYKNTFYSPVIHLTGLTKNNVIEKNLFYIGPKANPGIDNTLLHFSNHDNAYGQGDIFRNNFIYTAEPANYAEEEKSGNNQFQDNLYTGPLKTPSKGFTRYEGKFDRNMWYDAKDENWNKLIDFLKDKKVPVDGKEIPVLEIIGYN